MEFLEVRFHESRPVVIDGHEQGKTNLVIELSGGLHTISLGGKGSVFSPLEQTVFINNTTVVSPYVVSFT
ncbi:MAG: hypothetical protein LUQ26_02135 [Methylococcaceae bacterium]|nr:hypothetical protein [Methylococcaceae bacterium]